MPNWLFVCSKNKLRSPTAEAVFAAHDGLEVESAGLDHDAEEPLGPEQLRWADVVFVMEKTHRTRLNRRFRDHLRGTKVVVLGIPDRYAFMDEELVALLHQRCRPYLKG
jgi:predicted protein tyrosine phosphatase